MFLTISYLSNASYQLTDEDIDALMINTKDFNDANNISGILIYSDLTFFQVLEGENNIIVSLFEKIKQDYRHYNILKILEIKSNKRRFNRYYTNFITHHNKSATKELTKLLENTNEYMLDHKLHSLVVYQSRALMNLY